MAKRGIEGGPVFELHRTMELASSSQRVQQLDDYRITNTSSLQLLQLDESRLSRAVHFEQGAECFMAS